MWVNNVFRIYPRNQPLLYCQETERGRRRDLDLDKDYTLLSVFSDMHWLAIANSQRYGNSQPVSVSLFLMHVTVLRARITRDIRKMSFLNLDIMSKRIRESNYCYLSSLLSKTRLLTIPGLLCFKYSNPIFSSSFISCFLSC